MKRRMGFAKVDLGYSSNESPSLQACMRLAEDTWLLRPRNSRNWNLRMFPIRCISIYHTASAKTNIWLILTEERRLHSQQPHLSLLIYFYLSICTLQRRHMLETNHQREHVTNHLPHESHKLGRCSYIQQSKPASRQFGITDMTSQPAGYLWRKD